MRVCASHKSSASTFGLARDGYCVWGCLHSMLLILAMCFIRTTALGLRPSVRALMLTDANMAAAGLHF